MARSDIAVLWSTEQTWLFKEIRGGQLRWDCGQVSPDRAFRFARDHGIEFHFWTMHKGKLVDIEDLSVN